MTNDVRPATGPQKTRKISVIQDRNRATFAHFGGILGIIPSAAVNILNQQAAAQRHLTRGRRLAAHAGGV